MKKNLKTVSVAIPKLQFNQIVDYTEKRKKEGEMEPTVASFLREAITEYLSSNGYEEVKCTVAARKGRPSLNKK